MRSEVVKSELKHAAWFPAEGFYDTRPLEEFLKDIPHRLTGYHRPDREGVALEVFFKTKEVAHQTLKGWLADKYLFEKSLFMQHNDARVLTSPR